MAALYWQRPTAEQLAGTGLKPKHYVEPEVVVWPENWRAIEVFRRFSTQWRVGPAGPIGLDYGVIQYEATRMHLTDAEYDDLMEKIRVIEDAAMEVNRNHD